MSTIEINRVEDLREGDFVTLRWEHVDGATVTLEGPMWNRMVGGWAVTDARFVSATREAPEWEPGTAGTATVMGTPGVRVMRVQLDDRATDARPWFTDHTIGGWFAHAEGDVTDFVPDDASRWAAQAKLAEADLDNARAEVERWKAEAEMLTAKVDRLMPLQEHENECSYRQRSEKAEAEVERLRAELEGLRDAMDGSTHFLISSGGTIWHHDQNCPNRRTVPTREQVAMSMYAELKGAMDLSWGRLDPIDRGEWERAADTVLALIEQGGAR